MDYLAHYGVAADHNPPGRGSGRYPRCSGNKEDDVNDPYYLCPKNGSVPGAYPLTNVEEFFAILSKPTL